VWQGVDELVDRVLSAVRERAKQESAEAKTLAARHGQSLADMRGAEDREESEDRVAQRSESAIDVRRSAAGADRAHEAGPRPGAQERKGLFC
jgi:hypothetical protein